MEPPTNCLKQIVYNTRPEIERPMLNVMDKSTYDEHSSQPLHTNFEQFQLPITILTEYNGIFNVTNKNIKVCFTPTINDDVLRAITFPPEAYGLESLREEIIRVIIENSCFTETKYPFSIQPRFLTSSGNVGVISKSLYKSRY